MVDVSDTDLLRDFARARSEAAFTELARRYLPLVRAAARRQLSDPHTAEDVAQAVFLVLAKKARRLKGPLAGWLIKTTHFCALDAQKLQRRREFHERRAAAMRRESTSQDSPGEPAAFLDAALAGLGDTDRNALTLHFLQQRPIPAVAGLLGMTDTAVRKRIDRAIAKLQRRLAGRSPAADSGHEFPAALAAAAPLAISHAAAAEFAKTALLAGSHSAESAMPALISKGAMHMMTVAKMKIAAGLALGVFAAGVASYGVLRPAFAQNAASPPAAIASAPSPTPAAAANAPAANPLGYEIVAIGPYGDNNHEWWSPGGEKITFERPIKFIPEQQADPVRPNEKRYEIAVHASPSLPPFADPAWAKIRNGNSTTEWSYLSISAPAAATTTSLRVEYAKGPWQTVLSVPLSPPHGMFMRDLPGGHKLAIVGPMQEASSFDVVVVEDLTRGLFIPRRSIAVAKDGQEPTTQGTGSSSGSFSVSIASFNNVKASDIARVRCEVLPHDTWLQFDNISLDGKPTRPAASTGTLPIPPELAALAAAATLTGGPPPAPPQPTGGTSLP